MGSENLPQETLAEELLDLAAKFGADAAEVISRDRCLDRSF